MPFYVFDVEAVLRPGAPGTEPECTGPSASWCPVHGDCTCANRDDGLSDDGCPLHGMMSGHGDDPTSKPRSGEQLPAAIWWDLVSCAVLKLDAVTYMPERLDLLGYGNGGDGSPKAIIRQFAALVAQENTVLVSFNGRGFDLPVMIATAYGEGVRCPALWHRSIDDRYRGEGHIDMLDAFTMHGAARYPGVDGLCKRIGWPGKDGINGADVAGLVKQGLIERVKAYNLCDVAQEGACFMRLRVAQGLLNREQFKQSGTALLDMCAADARTAELAAKVDRTRFLLEG